MNSSNQNYNQNQNQNQNRNQNQNTKNQNGQNGQNNPNKEVRDQMNGSDKRFWTIVAAIIVIGGLVLLGMHNSASAPASSTAVIDTGEATTTDSTSTDAVGETAVDVSASTTQTYVYSCDGNKSVSATFHLPKDDFANVNLSGGQHLILAHAISADGARYANANESIVFWTKGVTAFVEQNGTTTYSGCVANRFP